jgi:hypothetical protein
MQPGDLVQVTLRMEGIPPATPAAGFQAFFQFDATRMTFVNGLYTSAPFGLHIISPITPVGDTLDCAAGINTFINQQPTSADSDLVVFTFQIVTPCGPGDMVFRTHKPPTRISDADGDPILPLALVDYMPFLTCPADVFPTGSVDSDDLTRVILQWGACANPPPACCPGDVDGNGAVDADDLTAVILAWGPCP